MLRILQLLLAPLIFYLPQQSSLQAQQQEPDGWRRQAQLRIRQRFAEAELPFPPERIALLALKQSRRLELWSGVEGGWRLVHNYAILGASGTAGPKLRQGDKQVPEGIYRILLLNPASRYHLSMKLDYPNADDLAHARKEGRRNPGGDIFIHGRDVSIGCLAIGDPAIEELYLLAEQIGVAQISVYIAPRDPRIEPLSAPHGSPAWLDARYQQLNALFEQFR
jgi:murein L,D-transpeptidase YafK